MPQSRTGHASVIIDSFDGGIVKRKSAEGLAENEMQQCENFMFDYLTGSLTTRPGLTMKFNASVNIDTLFNAGNYWLFSSGTTLYKTDLTTKSTVGTLSGSGTPVYSLYNNMVLIASGGALQAYDGATFTTTTSPNCDIVFERSAQTGRVIIARAGYDHLIYSSTGDATSSSAWTINQPTNPASAYDLPIGYQDGCTISSIVPLSTDILVFKRASTTANKNRVYRVVGEPTFSTGGVYLQSTNADCINRYSALQAGNNVYFIGFNGLKAFETKIQYGGIGETPTETGININTYLVKNLDSSCKIWHIQNLKQLWIKFQNSPYVFVFHYLTGAFTMFNFYTTISDVATSSLQTYVAKGQKIYLFDSSASTDDGTVIKASFKGKRFVTTKRAIVLKRIIFNANNIFTGSASFTVGSYSLPISMASSSPLLKGNTTLLHGNTSPLFSGQLMSINKRMSARMKYFEPTLIVNSGGLAMRNIQLDVEEK